MVHPTVDARAVATGHERACGPICPLACLATHHISHCALFCRLAREFSSVGHGLDDPLHHRGLGTGLVGIGSAQTSISRRDQTLG